MKRTLVLKIFYASLVLLLNMFQLESSLELDYAGSDEGRSLEQCFSQRNYRLGSVYGNLTRHHRKERRRRYTSTTQTPSSTSPTNLPQLQQRSRRSYKGVTAVRSNRIPNLKSKEKGIFLTDNCTTVVAQIGTTAVLHCEVTDITENTVTWIRKKDYSLLSVGLVTYSADNRFFSAHGKHIKDWALHIRFATPLDGGYYECQVPTHPPTSIFYKLLLVAATAEIVGESEKLIHEGSMLRLVCVVRNSTEPPTYVFWYFEDRMINYDQNGVSVVYGRQSSELIISGALPKHAGNYTCVPANAKPASVTVHVVQSETPAAMQHGNSNNYESIHISRKYFIIILIQIMKLLIGL